MMITADVGVPAPLELIAFDGNPSKWVRATVRNSAGGLFTTVNLSHVGEGLYTGFWTPPALGYYYVNYIVYKDSGYLHEDPLYTRVTQLYRVTLPSTDPSAIANYIWEDLLSDHNSSGSFGWAINQILSKADPSVISTAVWQQFLADFDVAGTFGWAINELLTNFDPSTIAGSVWDEFVADHVIPNTFGDYFRATWNYARTITNEITHVIWGNHALYDLAVTHFNNLTGDIASLDGNVDALYPYINNAKTDILGAVTFNTSLLNQMAIQNATDKADILNQFPITNNKIDNIASLVGTLQNNTTVRFVVPDRLIKPDSGTKDYQFHLRLYDDVGNPEAPDATPTIRIRRLDTGVDIVVSDVMTQDGIKVGAYYYVHTISSGTNTYPMLVEATIIEGGITRYVPAVSEITEFESDLNAIQAQIAAVDTKVGTTNAYVSNPTYGLPALRTGELDILNALSAEAVTLGQIKARTDLIPNNIATVTDINDVLMQLAEKPTIDDIQARLDLTESTIMGTAGRTITDVYDKWDISTLMKTNDPRLNYLDAAISSRSTLTAAQVWGYGNRTLTDFTLDTNSIRNIWSYLASQANVPGSIGKLIADYLDASVSSRATALEVETLLSGVAQQSTLLDLQTSTDQNFTQVKGKLDNITTKVIGIKAKTDTIPPDPARESTILDNSTVIRTDISNLDVKVGQVKVKTDALPPDPAKETSVQARPTNPVLTTDPRLTNLDARVSTRSTLSSIDLAPLAKTSDVHTSEGHILDAVDDQTALINAVITLATAIKSRTDRIPVDPATITAINNATAEIIDAIGQIEAGEISAAAVWSYVNRTLTQDPSEFGPDISNLATKADVAAISMPSQYTNRMSTSFNPGSGLQEVIVWPEKNGLRVLAAGICQITIKDSLGATKWSQLSSTPSSDGVYRFINPMVLNSDENYYIIISIVVDGVPRVTQQAFVTIG